MDPQNPPQEASPAQTTPLEMPANWPGGFGAYKYSKQAVKLNLGSILLVFVIGIVLNLVLDIALKNIGRIVVYLIGPILETALVYLYICGVRNQKVELGESLSKGVNLWLKMLLLEILVILSIIGSLVLLVIPFFFVFPRLTLASYFLVDKDMEVVEAYKASWHNTKGHIGKIYGVVGATIAMALLMVTIIGIPFAAYFLVMYSAAYAVLYAFILREAAQAT